MLSIILTVFGGHITSGCRKVLKEDTQSNDTLRYRVYARHISRLSKVLGTLVHSLNGKFLKAVKLSCGSLILKRKAARVQMQRS